MQSLTRKLIMENEHLSHLHFHSHIKDLDGKYVDCNDRVISDAGFSIRDEFIGSTDYDFDFLPRIQAKLFRQHDREVIAKKQALFFMEPCRLADGVEWIALSHKAPAYVGKKIMGSVALSFMVQKNEISFLTNIILPDIQKIHAHFSIKEYVLTKRQIECLHLLVKGKTIKKIALILHLSAKTVEHYLDAIKLKLNANDRSELIEKALQLPQIREKL